MSAIDSCLGRHVLLDLSDCRPEKLDDPQLLSNVLERAIQLSGATIVAKNVHQFQPKGLSMVYTLAESHLSIHTWPDLGYASLDMYTCGRCDPTVAASYIVSELGATACQSYIERGRKSQSAETYFHALIDRH